MEVDESIQPDLQDALTATTTNDDNATPQVEDQPQLPKIRPEEIPPGAKWTKTIHPKGRQARDPLAQQVRLTAHSADEMESLLHDYLANPTSPPEHTTVEITFPTSSAFMVYTGDYSGGSQPKANLYGTLNRSALSVDAALSACAADLKDGLKKQKSIAKTLVEHVARADGFRYSFHNNWLSKEDEAHRFSYFCNDSTLNKGRAANEGKGMDNKRKMKPVYDCHGTIHVKFSVTKHSMELHYKHIPIHATYEERAPQPRRNSKRRKIMEVFEPEKLIRERKRKAKAEKQPKAPKRRATEPLPGTADALAADGADGLAPLLDFLGSADQAAEGNPDDSTLTLNDEALPTDGVHYSASRLETLKKTTSAKRKYPAQRQGIVRPPNLQVPGMMSGFMSGDLITWGPREKKKGKDAASSAPAAEPLAGIAQAAAQVDSETAAAGLSELEILKAKLAEAEQRINRLESEKSSTPKSAHNGHGGPPGWPPPPVPHSYGYPQPPQFGHVQGGPPYQQHGQQQQYQYPPPPQLGQQQQGQSQHMSPHSAGPATPVGGELKTVHWDPRKGKGSRGGRSGGGGGATQRDSEPAKGPPPRGGQVLRM